MAQAHAVSSLSFSLPNAAAAKSVRPRALLQVPQSSRISSGFTSSFKRGSIHFLKMTVRKRTLERQAMSVSIRCEQGTKENGGLDVWLGRLGMVGFATAVGVEIATGKGLLENFGLLTPLPTVALAITALVGVLTAVFIFQSASSD